MSYRIVKFPLANAEKSIIVKVSSKKGGHKLDLDLLATDGDEVWRGKVRERHVEHLRDSEYTGPRNEWENLLDYALGGGMAADLSNDMREGLDVKCKLSGSGPKSKLTINLQISVEDIKSKRGSLQLDYSTKTDDVEFYDWTCQLVDERNKLHQQVTHQQTNLSGEGSRVESLQRQLNELIISKKEQETQMLAKFTRLLNEKKLRIRVQQRQIAEQDRPANSGSMANRSSARKRKTAKAEEHLSSDPESEGFDDMEVDRETEDEQTVQSDQGLRTESETEPEPGISQLQTNTILEDSTRAEEQENDLPAVRTLPSPSKTKVKAESPSVVIPLPARTTKTPASDSEIESDDDEL